MIGDPAPQPLVSLNEAKAYLRIQTGEEEALLAGLLRTASSVCETFLDQLVLSRSFREEVAASTEWQRLHLAPVRTVESVEIVAADGSSRMLSSHEFAADIDARGDGWVRLMSPANARRLRVGGTAGIATDVNDVAEPIRQGVLRLTAHLFASRDGPGGEPPAAVTALWRPYRRTRLA